MSVLGKRNFGRYAQGQGQLTEMQLARSNHNRELAREIQLQQQLQATAFPVSVFPSLSSVTLPAATAQEGELTVEQRARSDHNRKQALQIQRQLQQQRQLQHQRQLQQQRQLQHQRQLQQQLQLQAATIRVSSVSSLSAVPAAKARDLVWTPQFAGRLKEGWRVLRQHRYRQTILSSSSTYSTIPKYPFELPNLGESNKDYGTRAEPLIMRIVGNENHLHFTKLSELDKYDGVVWGDQKRKLEVKNYWMFAGKGVLQFQTKKIPEAGQHLTYAWGCFDGVFTIEYDEKKFAKYKKATSDAVGHHYRVPVIDCKKIAEWLY